MLRREGHRDDRFGIQDVCCAKGVLTTDAWVTNFGSVKMPQNGVGGNARLYGTELYRVERVDSSPYDEDGTGEQVISGAQGTRYTWAADARV